MNNKIKLAIAVAVGIVGGGVISTLGGGESTKQLGSASLASGRSFLNGQEMVLHSDVRMVRFRDVLVDINVELLEELELLNLLQYVRSVRMWVDLDEFLPENPDFDANMFLQVDPNYGPKE